MTKRGLHGICYDLMNRLEIGFVVYKINRNRVERLKYFWQTGAIGKIRGKYTKTLELPISCETHG